MVETNKAEAGQAGQAGKATEGWFFILQEARKLQVKNGRPFTAGELAFAANIQKGTSAEAAHIASAWLGKFAGWGYVVRGEPIKSGSAGRPLTTYTLTEEGMKCKERPGRVTRLIRAVISFEAARGTADEEEAYKTLIQVCRQVEKNEDNER